MRAELRSVVFDPEPVTLPDDPAAFAFAAQLLVGPKGGAGEELFHVSVAAPEWLAARCREDPVVSGEHQVFVDFETFDVRRLAAWLERRVTAVEGPSWDALAQQLSRLGSWEFDGYIE